MYCKVRFTSLDHGSTAGLIVESDSLRASTISDISRLFPYSESMKMQRLEVSREYPDSESALSHDWESGEYADVINKCIDGKWRRG